MKIIFPTLALLPLFLSACIGDVVEVEDADTKSSVAFTSELSNTISSNNDKLSEFQNSDAVIISSANLSSLIVSVSSEENLSSELFLSQPEDGSSMSLSSSEVLSSSSKYVISYSNFVDSRDNKTYKTLKVGTQEWMAENLNFGELSITEFFTSEETYQSFGQKFCAQDLESNCTLGGGLYQWHTSMNLAKECGDGSKNCNSEINEVHQGICPVNWHIPTQKEWTILANHFGGVNVAGSVMKMTNTGHLYWDNTYNNLGDTSGFSAYPIGFYYFYESRVNFTDMGYVFRTWLPVDTYTKATDFQSFDNGHAMYFSTLAKNLGFSVRCLKD